MSDTAKSLLIFLLVLSPLYIPIAGAIADWRETMRTRSRSKVPTSRPAIAGEEPQPLAASSTYPSAITPRAHLDAPPTESDTEAA